MKTSESIKEISVALLEIQTKASTIFKNAIVSNGKFSYSYAELSKIVDDVYVTLHENKIFVNQPINRDVVQTRLTHVSGEWVEDEGVEIKNARENDPQAQGSGITYARRYGLLSLLGIATTDDDGEKAMDRKQNEDTGDVMENLTNRVANGGEVVMCNKHNLKKIVSKTSGKLYCPKCAAEYYAQKEQEK